MTATARRTTEAQTDSRSRHDRWPLTRVLMFLLANAFAGLAMEIRVEHVDAVHEQGVAWTPIVYSCVMAATCLVAVVFWNKTSRRVMLPLFLLSFVVGGLGFYFHNHGNLKRVIKTSVNAWTNASMNHSDGPPQMAPLAFGGLGMIGILSSLRRFNP